LIINDLIIQKKQLKTYRFIFVHSPNGNVQLEAVIPLVVGKNSRIRTAFQLLRVLPLIVKNRLVMREKAIRMNRETRFGLQDFEKTIVF
jgi:hypothetical protein